MTRNPQHHLATAKYHFSIAVEHGQRELTDQVTIDAISLRIMAGVDALNELTPEAREALVGDAWRDMRAMRNRIAHAYDTVDSKRLEQTLREDIPILIERLDALLAT